uniref:Uncharacterized protein n=1 Tax=Romanomermis culicivorax TaxID=13658 RepID=A0A915JTG3_ROMCU
MPSMRERVIFSTNCRETSAENRKLLDQVKAKCVRSWEFYHKKFIETKSEFLEFYYLKNFKTSYLFPNSYKLGRKDMKCAGTHLSDIFIIHLTLSKEYPTFPRFLQEIPGIYPDLPVQLKIPGLFPLKMRTADNKNYNLRFPPFVQTAAAKRTCQTQNSMLTLCTQFLELALELLEFAPRFRKL